MNRIEWKATDDPGKHDPVMVGADEDGNLYEMYRHPHDADPAHYCVVVYRSLSNDPGDCDEIEGGPWAEIQEREMFDWCEQIAENLCTEIGG